MRIIFIRHGEPNYERDCLTENGRRQAAAAAERLSGEEISKIYSSPNGRAWETAEYTSRRIGLPIIRLEYMHEISWGGEGLPENGHPWTLSDRMIDEGDDCLQEWRRHPFFAGNDAVRYYDMIAGKIDELMLSHGYRHEKGRFFCKSGTEETIAIFSHGGSGACAMASLLGLPFPFVCSVMPFYYTSVTILQFPVQSGLYVHPRIELFNDAAHVGSAEREILLQEDSE